MIQGLSAIVPRVAIGLMNIVAASIKRRVTIGINLKPCSLCGAKMEGEKMAEWRINISEIVDRVVEQLKSDGFMVVKHGKWEHNRCTECGKSLDDLFSGDFYYDEEELKYCPNCGAKMEGE